MADLTLFDMDGTLTDTARGTIVAVHECAERYGLPRLPDEVVRQAIGWAAREFYHRLYPALEEPAFSQFQKDAEQREGEVLLALGTDLLFPGVEDMLASLAREGKTICLASTGSSEHVDICMRATGIARYFDMICCGEPDKAAMVGRILAHYALPAAVMIGDTQKDASAARANGLGVIGAGFGYCDANRAALFDRVAATPAQLTGWLR